MPRTIRIHLDENCARSLAAGLRQQGIDVTTTPEANLCEASDEKQLEFALTEQRVIVSHDTDMLKLHASGVNHGGIIYSRIGRRTNRELTEGIVLICDHYTSEEMQNRVEYI
jgi:predicted nuclease of predicted toxin-antitoxin system